MKNVALIPFAVSTLMGIGFHSQASELDSHWYLGVDVGQGYYSNGGNVGAHRADRNQLAGGAHLGYQINPYWAAELAYQYLGKAGASYIDGDIVGQFQQGVMSVQLGYPLLDSKLKPYIKAGGGLWFGESKGFVGHNSANGLSVVYGAGVAYQISERMSLRVEYQATEDLGDAGTRYADSHLATVGFSWRFGGKTLASSIPVPPKVVKEPEAVVIEKNYVFASNRSQAQFANNSSEIVQATSFDVVVELLLAHSELTAEVSGHTDSVGRADYNLELSLQRAQAVADYLVQRGVHPSRLNVRGVGEAEPVVSNDTIEGKAQNRRVEILVEGNVEVVPST